jgi:hypothetical protein
MSTISIDGRRRRRTAVDGLALAPSSLLPSTLVLRSASADSWGASLSLTTPF